MQMRFFLIPVYGMDAASEDLNKFLRSHRVVSVHRELISDGANSAWAVCINYVENGSFDGNVSRNGSKAKIDYKVMLDEKSFATFAKLRTLRKEIATKEGVPVYALFTNEQLATMVQSGVTTVTALQQVPGVGQARVEKYGEAFLSVLRSDIALSDEPTIPSPTSENIEHEAIQPQS